MNTKRADWRMEYRFFTQALLSFHLIVPYAADNVKCLPSFKQGKRKVAPHDGWHRQANSCLRRNDITPA